MLILLLFRYCVVLERYNKFESGGTEYVPAVRLPARGGTGKLQPLEKGDEVIHSRHCFNVV